MKCLFSLLVAPVEYKSALDSKPSVLSDLWGGAYWVRVEESKRSHRGKYAIYVPSPSQKKCGLFLFLWRLWQSLFSKRRSHKADRTEGNRFRGGERVSKTGRRKSVWTRRRSNPSEISNLHIVWRMVVFTDVVFIYTYKFIIAPPPLSGDPASIFFSSPLSLFFPSPLSLHRLQSKDNRLALLGWTVKKYIYTQDLLYRKTLSLR